MALGFGILLLSGCNDSESDLLETKVYFESKELKVVVDLEKEMSSELQVRVSNMCAVPVEVSYEVADSGYVKEYNAKNGTEYKVFDAANVQLETATSVIADGEVYSEKASVKLSNLGSLEEGDKYLLPVRVKSNSLPVVDGRDITYFVISKKVRIMKVAQFRSNYIQVAWERLFSSVTYEALVYVDNFYSNNTVLGCEGLLILRLGDEPLTPSNILEIAGKQNFKASQGLDARKWYHVAFSYDQPSGKAALYINGEKVSEASWDTPSFDLVSDGGGFFIGKVNGFKWGERPLYGKMSEVRVWSVSRTANQIKENMLAVDPATEGLATYYKLNGTDQYQDENGAWKVKDASGHGMDGDVNGGSRALEIVELENPIDVK